MAMLMHIQLHLHAIFLLVSLACCATSCEQEDYWKMKLPKLPMSEIIKDNLYSHGKEKAEGTIVPFTMKMNEKKSSSNKPYKYFYDYFGYNKENGHTNKASLNKPYKYLYDYFGYNKEDNVEAMKASSNKPYKYLYDYFGYNVENGDMKKASGSNKPYKYLYDYFGYNAENGDIKKASGSNKPYKYIYDYFGYNNAEMGDMKKASGSNKPYKYLYDYFGYNNAENGDIKKASGSNKPYKYLYDYFDYNAENGDIKKASGSNKPYKYLYDYFGYNAENGDMKKTSGSNKPYKYLYDYFGYDAENGDMKKDSSNKPYKYLYDYFGYNAKNVEAKTNKVTTTFTSKVTTTVTSKVTITFTSKPGEKDSKDENIAIHKDSFHHHNFMHNNVENSDEVSPTISSNDTLMFMEKDLQLGMKLPHNFLKLPIRPLLPKHIVRSFPFSVDKLTDILSLFSINSDSESATDIKDTLGHCFNKPKFKEENRTCAQSIEDVVDFVVRELGTNEVELTAMNINMEVPNGRQDYVITKLEKLDVPGKNAVVCHKMRYPYVVYYCYHQQGIGHYDVTLVSPGGVVVQTTAICHYDTYAWDPKSYVLRALGLNPGDSPLCHFAFLSDMFWNLKPVSKSLNMVQ